MNEHFESLGEIITVPKLAFEDIADEVGHLDFIKMDTEGEEMRILTGMMPYIREHRPQMVVEVNWGRNYDARPILSEMMDIYGPMRYVGHDGHPHSLTLETMATENVGRDWLVYFATAE